MSSSVRYATAALFLLVLASAQVSVFSRMSVGAAAPQLVLLFVVAWSLAKGPAEGVFWGFAGGLFYDLASGGPVGVSALAMVVVAAIAGGFSRLMFGSNPLLPMLSMLWATGVYFIIVSFLLATLHYPTDWGAVLRDVALPTAVANAVLSLIVYPLVSFAATHTRRQVRVQF